MNRKQLKNLAKEIANAEVIIQNSNNSKEISEAKSKIYKLSASIQTLEDMLYVDEIIQEFFRKKI